MLKMEAESLEEMGSDLKSGDQSAAEAADIPNSDDPTEPEGESCAVGVEEGVEEGVDVGVEVDEEVDVGVDVGVEVDVGVDVGVEVDVGVDVGVDVEVKESVQAARKEDEGTVQNAAEHPEEEYEACDVPGGEDPEETAVSDVEIIENEDEEEEEEDPRQSTADDQPSHQLDPEDEQELLRELQREHEQLIQRNYQLQTQLAEYFCSKSGGELQSIQEKLLPNQECCQKYPEILEDIMRQSQDKKQSHLQQRHAEELLQQHNEKLKQIEMEWSSLISAQHEVVVAHLEQANGRAKAQAVAERLLTAAQTCEDEYVSVRHENFKLNLKTLKLEPQFLVRNEDLDGEMYHIDFEQLIIENQTYSKKIQENMKDLLKLRSTVPQTGQIVMHIKEKLRFVQMESQEKRVRLEELDASLMQEKKALMQTMQARDTLRFDNLRKRQDCGMLGSPALLQDFEDTKDEHEALERQVEMLKKS